MGFVFQDANIIGDDNHRYSRSSPFDKWGTHPHFHGFPRRRILVWATYWLDHRSFGFNADRWRHSSMLLHAFTAMMLLPVSIPAAVLAFVHPLTTMGSSYIAGRSGLLSGMLQLLIGLLAINGIFVPAIVLAFIAWRWVKEDSLVFFPMIGVLWLMR